MARWSPSASPPAAPASREPNPKTWAAFRTSTAQNLAALADLLAPHGSTHVVATVPPQHMYGMEMSVLLPLLGAVGDARRAPVLPRRCRARAAPTRPRRRCW